MVHIDHERRGLLNSIGNAEDGLEEAKWDLFCYDNDQKLKEYNLTPTIALPFASFERVLHSDVGLEKCVFDDSKLRMAAPIIGGTDMEDSTIYECKKCKVKYMTPLTEKDKKEKEMRNRTYRISA